MHTPDNNPVTNLFYNHACINTNLDNNSMKTNIFIYTTADSVVSVSNMKHNQFYTNINGSVRKTIIYFPNILFFSLLQYRYSIKAVSKKL